MTRPVTVTSASAGSATKASDGGSVKAQAIPRTASPSVAKPHTTVRSLIARRKPGMSERASQAVRLAGSSPATK